MEAEKNILEKQKERYSEDDIIDLKDIFYEICFKWWLILLIAVMTAVLAGTYHQFFIHSRYRADAKIYITNTDSMISFSDLQLSAALTDDYADIIKSRTVLQKVIKRMDLDIDYTELDKLISVTNPDSTHILHIFVTCDDPELAIDIANTILDISIEQIYQIIGSSKPTVIDDAETVKDLTPGFFKYVFLGGIVGAVAACIAIFIRVVFNTKLQTGEDVEKYLSLPVLSVVPLYNTKKSNHAGKRYE